MYRKNTAYGRVILHNLTLFFTFLVVSIGYLGMGFLLENIFGHFIGEMLWVTIPLLIFISYYLHLRYTKKYYIVPFSNIIFNEFKNKKLIHYTNFISPEAYLHYQCTGRIKLIGTSKAQLNYVMKLKDKQTPFVWFHVSDKDNEPNLKSLIFNHGHEYYPRKYKIIIEPVYLEADKLFLRPDNGNVVYKGNIEIKAEIEENFMWLENSFYFKEIFFGVLIQPFKISFYFILFHQAIGTIMDIKSKKTKKQG